MVWPNRVNPSRPCVETRVAKSPASARTSSTAAAAPATPPCRRSRSAKRLSAASLFEAVSALLISPACDCERPLGPPDSRRMRKAIGTLLVDHAGPTSSVPALTISRDPGAPIARPALPGSDRSSLPNSATIESPPPFVMALERRCSGADSRYACCFAPRRRFRRCSSLRSSRTDSRASRSARSSYARSLVPDPPHAEMPSTVIKKTRAVPSQARVRSRFNTD